MTMTDNTEPLPGEAAVAEATPAQLAIARRIYADYMRRTLTARGDEYDDALIREVTDGMHDGTHGVQIALAAIIETSERAAKYAAACPPDESRELIAAIRKGDHLND